MKWFYHAAETEGTAKGGGRVEDIKTPVGKLFVLLYVEDIRTPISLFNCVCLPCVCVHSNVFILSRGHQYSGGYNCVCFCSVSFAIALGTSL